MQNNTNCPDESKIGKSNFAHEKRFLANIYSHKKLYQSDPKTVTFHLVKNIQRNIIVKISNTPETKKNPKNSLHLRIHQNGRAWG